MNANRRPGPSPIMTVREVCDLLRIHSSTLYRMVRQQKFPAFKVGNEYRFNREAVRMWIVEAQRTKVQTGRNKKS